MMMSVRLDRATERALARLATRTGKSRSQLIREAIREMRQRVDAIDDNRTAFERLADVVGIVHLGPGRRAARSEEILRARFAAKRNAR